MKTQIISFKQAVRALQDADIVVIQHKNSGDRAVADFVGWEAEGEEESDFTVGAEGWDDVYLGHELKFERDGHVIRPPGYDVVLEMYEAKK